MYAGASAVISAPVYFSNGTTAPAYFTAPGSADTAQVYFTASSSTKSGTIVRTDGGSWLSDGFAVGNVISISGSALNSTGNDSFTITGVTGSVITLSTSNVIAAEATAKASERVTIQRNGTITRTDGGSWLSAGYAAGQTISVSGSAANSTGSVLYSISAVSAGTIALLPSDAIKTEASAAAPETITVNNGTGSTITRTDGGSWIAQGFAVGQTITVTGSAANNTGTGQTYTIAKITGSTITLATADVIVSEASAAAPETVSLQHNTTDSPDAIKSAYFTASTSTTPGSIVRTDGGNWLTDGFAVGQTILVTGSAGNSTVGATSYTVTAVTATTLTLSLGDSIVAEGSAGRPEAITVQHTFSYKMSAGEISHLESGIKEWTPQQLLTLFGAGLLKDVTNTVITNTGPNITTNGNVTILAATGGVGEQSGTPISIPLTYPTAQNGGQTTQLSPSQEAALAAAERVDTQYLAPLTFAATVNFGTNTITRTDNTSSTAWSGLVVGGYISISGNTADASDGTRYYEVTAINGNVLTISSTTPLPAVQTGVKVVVSPIVLYSFQPTAAADTVSVYFTATTSTAGGTLVRTTGSWIADGFAVGQLVEISGSNADSTPQGGADIITAVSATTITFSATDLIFAEGSASKLESVSVTRGTAPPIAPAEITATVNFAINGSVYTITRTDNTTSSAWAGLAVGDYLTVNAVTGGFTQNATDGTLFYKIDAINGNVLTIDAGTPLAASENTITVNIAPVILNPSFQATAGTENVPVYFTGTTNSAAGTITRTDGGSWITDGYAAGQLIEITGNTNNATSTDVPDMILSVTASTITVAMNDLIVSEASAGSPENIGITRGAVPQAYAILVDQITPLNVDASGLISVTAAHDVYLDSQVDIRLDQVLAGTTKIGAQVQIKGQGSIVNGKSSKTVNVQAGDVVLEAAGLSGDPGTIGTTSTPVKSGADRQRHVHRPSVGGGECGGVGGEWECGQPAAGNRFLADRRRSPVRRRLDHRRARQRLHHHPGRQYFPDGQRRHDRQCRQQYAELHLSGCHRHRHSERQRRHLDFAGRSGAEQRNQPGGRNP